MDDERYLSYLGLCKKANKLKTGHDEVKEAVRTGQAKLVLVASDASERLEREIRNLSGLTPVIRTRFAMDVLGSALGRKTAGVAAVTDEGFANKLIITPNGEGTANDS